MGGQENHSPIFHSVQFQGGKEVENPMHTLEAKDLHFLLILLPQIQGYEIALEGGILC